MSDTRSNYLKASATFAGHHHLLPHADERVADFQEFPNGTIAVTYQGRDKARIFLLERKAGGFGFLNSIVVRLPGAVAPSLERGLPAKPEFHLTPEQMIVKAAPRRRQSRKFRRRSLAGRKYHTKKGKVRNDSLR